MLGLGCREWNTVMCLDAQLLVASVWCLELGCPGRMALIMVVMCMSSASPDRKMRTLGMDFEFQYFRN